MSIPDPHDPLAEAPDPDGYLMRFEDGPLAQRGNIETLESKLTGRSMAASNVVVPGTVWSWPLPERLKVLAHEGVEQVAMWPEDEPGTLPQEITGSRNAITYVKASESQITDEQAAKMTHVMRGALYRLEQ